MSMLVLVLLGAMVFARGRCGAPVPPPGVPGPTLGAPPGPPPGTAGEEHRQGVRGVAVLAVLVALVALLDGLVPDEHAASTILTTPATARSALAALLAMSLQRPFL